MVRKAAAGATRSFVRATYQEILDAPPHKVAEIVDGILHLNPRPAPRHAAVSSGLGAIIGPPYFHGRGGPADGGSSSTSRKCIRARTSWCPIRQQFPPGADSIVSGGVCSGPQAGILSVRLFGAQPQAECGHHPEHGVQRRNPRSGKRPVEAFP